jgi:hypothetical protein
VIDDGADASFPRKRPTYPMDDVFVRLLYRFRCQLQGFSENGPNYFLPISGRGSCKAADSPFIILIYYIFCLSSPPLMRSPEAWGLERNILVR